MCRYNFLCLCRPRGRPRQTDLEIRMHNAMPYLRRQRSGHVDMGASGRHADEAFISPAANEPSSPHACGRIMKSVGAGGGARRFNPTAMMFRGSFSKVSSSSAINHDAKLRFSRFGSGLTEHLFGLFTALHFPSTV